MKLRKYVNPPFPAEDPELDVEAQFASRVVREAQKRIEKKKRLQCLSGWLWCKCAMPLAVPISFAGSLNNQFLIYDCLSSDGSSSIWNPQI